MAGDHTDLTQCLLEGFYCKPESLGVPLQMPAQSHYFKIVYLAYLLASSLLWVVGAEDSVSVCLTTPKIARDIKLGESTSIDNTAGNLDITDR
jgi:hypothetical protein